MKKQVRVYFMYEMKCSNCGEKIGWWWEGLVRPAFNSRICPACRVKLELLNPGFCHFINGIIFAVILVYIMFEGFPYMWLWVTLLGGFCWLIRPVIIRIFGRWVVWPYGEMETAKLQLLAAVNAVSTIIAGIWVAYMAVMVFMPYWKLLGDFNFSDDQLAEVIEGYKKIFSVRGIVGIIIGVVSLISATSTSAIKGKLRAKAIGELLKGSQK